MADGTKIEWTDATWNPVTGCAIVSPGCTNCYAMKLAGTRLKHHPSRKGLTKDSKAGPVWTGEVRFNREWLDQPLRWTKPRMIFVCAHGDLFAEGVPDEWIDQVFAVMALAPQHTFQVLTKRPERMRDYLTARRLEYRLSATQIKPEFPLPPQTPGRWPHLPLPNVWLGVSVEDQKRADERIPLLLDTPAAVRWISAEPLLGPVDLMHVPAIRISQNITVVRNALTGLDGCGNFGPKLDWVVAGGESGPDARPMHPDWARELRDQCAASGVPFLFKQWGNWADFSDIEPKPTFPEERIFTTSGEVVGVGVDYGRKGMVDPDWRERGAAWMGRCSKSYAGRLLDGVEHNGFPERGN
ncbi:protein gp37 [Sinorhizobium fredii]|uniref:phage Gp37/Gp68 family protein n=1 Tax=Rhizobium fredii TaxID=380 RepID=UPI0035130732